MAGLTAEECRNPHTRTLQRFAAAEGDKWVAKCDAAGIAGVAWRLGGALAYDAALVGGNDIDLRLLLPGEWTDPDVRSQIDRVCDLLTGEYQANATFRTRTIDEGGTNYIRHAKCMVRIEGVDGEVELSWNVQAAKSYVGLGAMASRLPKELLDRYVLAKMAGKQSGPRAYDEVKRTWQRFLKRLREHGADKMSGEELEQLLSDPMMRPY